MLPKEELIKELERVQFWISNWDERSPYQPSISWATRWGEKNYHPHEIIDMAIVRIEEGE